MIDPTTEPEIEPTDATSVPGGNGGDVTLAVGMAAPGGVHGSFRFMIPKEGGGQTELLRFDPDGSFFFKGEKQAEDRLAYECFRHWLIQAQASLGRGCTRHGRDDAGEVIPFAIPTEKLDRADLLAEVCSVCGNEFAPGHVQLPDEEGGLRHVSGFQGCYFFQ